MAFSRRAVQVEKLNRSKELTIDHQYLIGVFNQHYRSIYRFIYRHLGDQETSKELASETFKRLVHTCKKKKLVQAQALPWLYRTAHNLLIDHYRKQNHRNHLPLREDLAEKSMLPPDIVDKKISETYIRKALKHLTAEQRTIIVLKYLEGKSNQEIADILGKSVGAVKSMQHRALNALRRMLAEVMEG